MPTSYRVFLGAPSMQDIANDPKDYSWRTTSSISRSNSGTGNIYKDATGPVVRTQSAGSTGAGGAGSSTRDGLDANANANIKTDRSLKATSTLPIQRERTHSNLNPPTTTHSLWNLRQSQSFVLPKATLEEASRRISLIYRDLLPSRLAGAGEDEVDYDEEDAEVDWGAGGGGEEDEDDSLYGSEGLADAKASNSRGGMGVRTESSGLESAMFDSRAEVSSDGEVIVPGLNASTSSGSRSKSGEVDDSVSRGAEQTTLISWPPSNSRLQDADSRGDIPQTSNRGVETSSSEGEIVIPGLDPTNANAKSTEVSVFRGAEQTTLISWPPSNSRLHADETRDNSRNQSFAGPSFLLDNTTEHTRSRIGTNPNPNTANGTPLFTQTETQALESQSFGAYSDASSIGRFPSFHFSLHALTPLAVLVNAHNTNMAKASTKPFAPTHNSGWHGPGGQGKPTNTKPSGPPRKVNLLLAVLEVDGPDSIRLKKGADAGTQVSVLKMILGDEAGNVVRLTAWRETAEEWSGQVEGGGKTEVKRGDIVHLENVNASTDPTTGTPTLTASPFLKSKLVICYRTMPSVPLDARLRPDLRLGISEPSVRRVAGVVEWFEQMAGIA